MGAIFVTQWKGFFNNSAGLKSTHLETVAQDWKMAKIGIDKFGGFTSNGVWSNKKI